MSDQTMLLMHEGRPIKTYPISTSKFGLGSQSGSSRTPLGKLEVAKKIGEGAKPGAVFKGRRPTGEVLRPNTPGRDPIVTRILWLRGKESQNANTFKRLIYIHGTPEEKNIGRPASYGCIRMKSRDVIDLYNRVGVGADVHVVRGSLAKTPEGKKYYARFGGLFRNKA
ncbi:MAG: L,D-transpeptidase [Verrucomicrobiota bacterium JB023]|nr:L,D-transpeptidase [Verrucomicrobiota bacterium JB023]